MDLKKRLLRDVGRAIADFDLIQAGDRILVGISGGKDGGEVAHLSRDPSLRWGDGRWLHESPWSNQKPIGSRRQRPISGP